MDGKDYKRRLNQLLNEDDDSGWVDARTTYDWLYDAATDWTEKTHCLKSSQDITMVADQTDYNLDPNYLKLFLQNSNGDYVVKWGDDTFLKWKDYNDIIYENRTDSVSIPDSFTIIDASLPDQVTGTATSDGAATGGKSNLTDTATDFTDVAPGDSIHNTSDGSTGVVLIKNSTTSIDTALFGGTANEWSSADAYVIQPQGRFKIVISPPPDGAETVTVNFVEKPDPVYSDYQTYRFVNSTAIIKYAYWLYKYRDSDPNLGDAMYRYWDSAVRKAGYSSNQALNRKVKISFKGRK